MNSSNEVWMNLEGKEIEIALNETEDCCFYRSYPWEHEEKRMWQGFLTIEQLINKGYTYVKTI